MLSNYHILKYLRGVSSRPLSPLIDVRAPRCAGVLWDGPPLVCIYPLWRTKLLATSCTMQPAHIDYTARGGRMKREGCVLSAGWGQYGPPSAEKLLFRIRHSLGFATAQDCGEKKDGFIEQERWPVKCMHHRVSPFQLVLFNSTWRAEDQWGDLINVTFSLRFIKLACFSSRWHTAVKR